MADALLAHPLVTLHWGASIARYTDEGGEVSLEVDTAARRPPPSCPVGGRLRRRPQPDARAGGREPPGQQLRGPLRHRRHPLAVRPPGRADGLVRPAQQPRLDGHHAPASPRTSGASTTSSTPPRTPRSRPRRAASAPGSPATSTGCGTTCPGPSSGTASTRPTPWPWTASSTAGSLFAGDAAHLVPIFGVRGLNSGMEDAETLVWMLRPSSAARRRHPPPRRLLGRAAPRLGAERRQRRQVDADHDPRQPRAPHDPRRACSRWRPLAPSSATSSTPGRAAPPTRGARR